MPIQYSIPTACLELRPHYLYVYLAFLHCRIERSIVAYVYFQMNALMRRPHPPADLPTETNTETHCKREKSSNIEYNAGSVGSHTIDNRRNVWSDDVELF